MKKRKVTDDITDALFELLKTKKLADITTTEIIQKAGVCRSSFYRNFYLPEDVIRQYGNAMLETISREIPLEQGKVREHIHGVNAYFWSQRERLSLIEKRGLFHLLEEPIKAHCTRQIQCMDGISTRYQTEFYAGATTQLTRAWVHNGFEESPQEISEITWKLLRREL